MGTFARTSLAFVAVAAAAACTHGADPGGPKDRPTPDDAAVEHIAKNLGVDVTYTFVTYRDSQFISGSVRFTNRGGDSIKAEAPPAHLWLKAYASPERRGTPIWDMDDDSLEFYRPQDIAAVVDIAPGGSWISPMPLLGTVADILRGNPPGRYYFTVQLELSQPRGRTPEFPAGELDLAGAGAGR